MKNKLVIVFLSLLSGIGGAWIFNKLNEPVQDFSSGNLDSTSNIEVSEKSLVSNRYSTLPPEQIDFVEASKLSTQSVVYIKNISSSSYQVTWMDLFFGGEPTKESRVSSGSGVILSPDGYIVTNSHVVEDADKIEVIFSRKTLTAELVGVDPATDLAVLKVQARNMPAITIGSSKDLSVGEWVIAVGNPFNLTSTVTAGIVSAKGRQINILKDKFPIESFIQTDAAINPGNSGGALVNREGKLVGINTAILSRTGSYAGYGFAVPSDIVNKVFHDIVKYGEVQKSFFGGEVEDFSSEMAKRFDIDINESFEGVLLVYLQKGGAAAKAGLKEGDVIVGIDSEKIITRANFEEELSYRTPGDKMMIKYKRNGKNYNTELVLTNREGTTEILKRKIHKSDYLNADFEEVPKVEKEVLGIDYGVRVFNIRRGRLSGMENNFVVTHINGTKIDKAEKLIEILESVDGVIWIEGVDEKGRKGRYRFYGR